MTMMLLVDKICSTQSVDDFENVNNTRMLMAHNCNDYFIIYLYTLAVSPSLGGSWQCKVNNKTLMIW